MIYKLHVLFVAINPASKIVPGTWELLSKCLLNEQTKVASDKDVERLDLSYFPGGMSNGTATLENRLAIS